MRLDEEEGHSDEEQQESIKKKQTLRTKRTLGQRGEENVKENYVDFN